MTHIGLIIITIVIYESLKLTKFFILINKNIIFNKKIIRLLKYKNASIHRKEKALLNYSKKLILISIKILIITSFVTLLTLITAYINKDIINLVFSFVGIFETIIIILIYYYSKKYFHEKL